MCFYVFFCLQLKRKKGLTEIVKPFLVYVSNTFTNDLSCLV